MLRAVLSEEEPHAAGAKHRWPCSPQCELMAIQAGTQNDTDVNISQPTLGPTAQQWETVLHLMRCEWKPRGSTMEKRGLGQVGPELKDSFQRRLS